jgi:hypothetical protein
MLLLVRPTFLCCVSPRQSSPSQRPWYRRKGCQSLHSGCAPRLIEFPCYLPLSFRFYRSPLPCFMFVSLDTAEETSYVCPDRCAETALGYNAPSSNPCECSLNPLPTLFQPLLVDIRFAMLFLEKTENNCHSFSICCKLPHFPSCQRETIE